MITHVFENQYFRLKVIQLCITYNLPLYKRIDDNIYSIGYIYNFYYIILSISITYKFFHVELLYNFCITFSNQYNFLILHIMSKNERHNPHHPADITQPEWIDTGKGEVLTFKTPLFERNGTVYMLTGMEKRGKEYIHTIKNTATGEIRELPHQDLQLWFRRAAV